MKYWIFILLALGCFGCENERPLYEGEKDGASGIYFSFSDATRNGIPVYKDSVVFSFQNVISGVDAYTLNIPIKLMGFVSETPRTFKARVCGGTAVENEDFVPLAAEYEFPALAEVAHLPVVLKRTDKLQESEITIEIELLENEHFRLLMPQIISFDDTLDVTRFKVIYSEIITQPFYWLSAASYFGDFSPEKIQFLNAIMEWSMEDWKNAGTEGAVITNGKFNYAARKMREELQTLADSGKPEYDEYNNGYMQLGAKYKVDYSRYENN